MRAPSWQIDDPEPTSAPVGVPEQGLVSLHFVRSTLQRRWKAWTAVAAAGLALSLGLNLVAPPPSIGTVTLYLAHDTGTDPNSAMATDVTLLRTRTVAQLTIDRLGIDLSPEDLQTEITVTPETSSIMVLTIPAADDAEATNRADVLASTYLEFRSSQLRSQADARISGQQERVGRLRDQVDELTNRYDRLVSGGTASQNETAAILTQRAQIVNQISSLQQDIEQTSLDVAAVVTASHVVDPAAAEPHSALRGLALAGMSGLIGGLAVGFAVILVTALTSLRLRRREEVARALGVPVLFSIDRLSSRLPWRRGGVEQRLRALATGLDAALLQPGDTGARIAIVSPSGSTDSAGIARVLGEHLARDGLSVCLVDLTPSGVLQSRHWRAAIRLPDGVTVARPDSATRAGAHPIALTREAPHGQPSSDQPWLDADIVLVVDEVDLGIGLTYLTEWADRAVLVLTAGGSSAEGLRTTARLFRGTGPELAFAVLVGADPADDSSGLTGRAPSSPLPLRRES